MLRELQGNTNKQLYEENITKNKFDKEKENIK